LFFSAPQLKRHSLGGCRPSTELYVFTYRSLPLALVLVATSVGQRTSEQWRRIPKFADFPVDSIYHGPVADVDLKSNAEARRFRTVLRQGAKAGPNFAGHMTVVKWGCGTSCIVLVVVDARTGTVYSSPQSAGQTIDYQLNSRLVVIDRIASCADTSWFPDFAFFLEWTGKGLVVRDSLHNTALCTR
jgi:hypothetical protein